MTPLSKAASLVVFGSLLSFGQSASAQFLLPKPHGTPELAKPNQANPRKDDDQPGTPLEPFQRVKPHEIDPLPRMAPIPETDMALCVPIDVVLNRIGDVRRRTRCESQLRRHDHQFTLDDQYIRRLEEMTRENEERRQAQERNSDCSGPILSQLCEGFSGGAREIGRRLVNRTRGSEPVGGPVVEIPYFGSEPDQDLVDHPKLVDLPDCQVYLQHVCNSEGRPIR